MLAQLLSSGPERGELGSRHPDVRDRDASDVRIGHTHVVQSDTTGRHIERSRERRALVAVGYARWVGQAKNRSDCLWRGLQAQEMRTGGLRQGCCAGCLQTSLTPYRLQRCVPLVREARTAPLASDWLPPRLASPRNGCAIGDGPVHADVRMAVPVRATVLTRQPRDRQLTIVCTVRLACEQVLEFLQHLKVTLTA